MHSDAGYAQRILFPGGRRQRTDVKTLLVFKTVWRIARSHQCDQNSTDQGCGAQQENEDEGGVQHLVG